MKQFRKLLLVFIILFFISISAKLYYPAFQAFGAEDSEISRVIYLAEAGLSNKLINFVDTDGKKLVAITFDDGPDPLFTAATLDILQRYNISATFFVVGESAAIHPELVKREAAEGHEIENHTYTHPDLRHKDAFKTEEEIRKTGYIIEQLCGTKAVFFRPPRKLYRNETIEVAERNGYKTILWTICVENKKAKTPEQMAERVVKAARPGMIILAHDGRLDRRPTLESLPLIIEGLQEKGYDFVTLETLMNQNKKK